MTRRALVVYNPVARGAPPIERLRGAVEGLAGWEVALEATEAAGHATELARRAAQQGLDAAVACGGDGTVNEAANGLARSETALAVVRGGTANVWAKEARLPRDPVRALRLLAEGEVRAIDLGRVLGLAPDEVAERFFLLMATVGADAAVVRDVGGGLKRRLGAAAYVLTGLRHLLTYRAAPAELRTDGAAERGPLYWLLLGNTRSYGGVVNIARLARADDGLLDLCLLARAGPLRLAWLLLWVLLRRQHRRGGLRYRQVSSLEIATPGLPVQIDGEYLGETPLRFEAVPRALRVVVPKGLRSPLFSSA